MKPFRQTLLRGVARLLGVSAAAPSRGWLLPAAEARWMSAARSYYTPPVVETLLRNAMAGDFLSAWELFDLMEDTWPRLSKNLNQLRNGVAGLDWNVQPWADTGEVATPEAHDRAKLVESAVWSMRADPAADENGFTDSLRDLLDARGKGISVVEVDWAGTAGRVLPRCTRWVHPQWLGWQADGKLGLRFANQGTMTRRTISGADVVPFPPDKFLVAVSKAKVGPIASGAQLRCLAWWWAATNFTSEWFLNFAQIFGQPIRWATYDTNMSDADQAKLKGLIADMGSSAYGMFPSGTNLELKEAGKGAGDNPQTALMDRADTACDLVILGQTLTSETPGSGSLALGEVHERVLAGVQLAAANWLAEVLNGQLVRSLIRLNFGDEEMLPRFVPAPRQVHDRKSTADGLVSARAAGVSLPKAWAYEQLDIPAPEPGDDVILPTEAAPGGMAGLPQPLGMTRGTPRFDSGASEPPEGMPTPPAEAARYKRNVEVRGEMGRKAPDEMKKQTVTGTLAGLLSAREEWVQPLARKMEALEKQMHDETIPFADVLAAVEEAAREMPELFGEMNYEAIAKELEAAMRRAAGLKSQI